MKRIGAGANPVKMASRLFFDRQSVIRRVGKKNAAILKEQGKILRGQARGLIRKRKGPSRPGAPPHSHFGQLRRFLYYKFDPGSKSVVVGPEKLGGGFYSVPESLEEGGRMPKRKNPRRVKREIGDGGIIQIAGKARDTKTGRFLKTASGTTLKTVTDMNGKRRRVVFAKLTSSEMLRRCDELETEIYGPMEIPSIRIEARPFMGPALNLSKNSLAAVWRDQLH